MITINQIVLKANEFIEDGSDVEQAIDQAIEEMEIELNEEQREAVKLGIERHEKAVQNDEEEEANAEQEEAEATADAEPALEPAEDDYTPEG